MSDRRALLLALVVLSAGCSLTPAPDRGATSWTVTVEEVVDGDTLAVTLPNGSRETVRLLGVDTPEVHVETDPAEFEGVPDSPAGRRWLRDWGHRAREFARTELAGERVTVRTDPAADRRGDYGRLLVYVDHDGEEFNRELLERGYARLYESRFGRRGAYEDAEADAQEAGVGLWGFDAAAIRTTTTGGGRADLAVVRVRADAPGNDHENPNGEFVVLRNAGDDPVDLSSWRVRDGGGHSYAFPDGFVLAAGATVTLYSGDGTDAGSELYWDAGGAVWNNDGDVVVVLDEDARPVRVEEYG